MSNNKTPAFEDAKYSSYDFSIDSEDKDFLELLNKAVKGDMDAQYEMGRHYEMGWYGDESLEKEMDWHPKALYWYKKAAEQGHVYAKCCVGYMYEDGFDVERNHEKAMYWFTQSAELGNSEAQFSLGRRFQKGGIGIEEDPAKAVFWFTKAAELGHNLSFEYLGECYRKGDGVEKDIKKAVYWLIKAVEADVTLSHEKLEDIVKQPGAAEKYGFTSDMGKINELLKKRRKELQELKEELDRKRTAWRRENE